MEWKEQSSNNRWPEKRKQVKALLYQGMGKEENVYAGKGRVPNITDRARQKLKLYLLGKGFTNVL